MVKREFEFDEDSGMITMTVDGERYGFIDPHTCPSYLTYRPSVLGFVICYNYSKKCFECHEPDCDGKQMIALRDSIKEPLARQKVIALIGYFRMEAHMYTDIEQLMKSIGRIKDGAKWVE